MTNWGMNIDFFVSFYNYFKINSGWKREETIPNLYFQLQQFTVNHLVRISIRKLIYCQTGNVWIDCRLS